MVPLIGLVLGGAYITMRHLQNPSAEKQSADKSAVTFYTISA